ncbi:MAG: aldo/keto reductase [Bacillota bacterium]|nr:aldo/keto reductase [Bacillota bacterium]
MQYRRISKNSNEASILGYGCMRFPTKNGKIDMERTEKQIMSAIERGVNYFDTAYLYMGSEAALGSILHKNGVREKVMIATKIPPYLVKSRKDMEKIFETQLQRLKTDYIDFYLAHALQDIKGWEKAKEVGLMGFLEEMKKKGVIRNIGFSYHGDKNDFKVIIDDYNWDFCQIQYNYIDESNQAGIEGLQYANSKGIGVVVMEPLRGGSLVGKMPEEIKGLWDKADVKRSYADWALRWLWSQPEVGVVLSGLNDESHIDENIKVASEIKPNSLTEAELKIFKEVKETYLRIMKVGCTGCAYCLPCPAGVNIPFCFSYYNSKHLFNNKHLVFQYLMFGGGATGGRNSLASKCIECGKCEKACPQHIEIRKKLKDVKKEMEPWWSGPLLNVIKGILKVKGLFSRGKKEVKDKTI